MRRHPQGVPITIAPDTIGLVVDFVGGTAIASGSSGITKHPSTVVSNFNLVPTPGLAKAFPFPLSPLQTHGSNPISPTLSSPHEQMRHHFAPPQISPE